MEQGGYWFSPLPTKDVNLLKLVVGCVLSVVLHVCWRQSEFAPYVSNKQAVNGWHTKTVKADTVADVDNVAWSSCFPYGPYIRQFLILCCNFVNNIAWVEKDVLNQSFPVNGIHFQHHYCACKHAVAWIS